ncbi:hypothetical protein [Streptomyces sp. NPDC051662]|uniref:hypothetical protein n=1 Tax=Streptomyces sp. NPDC051662 TaxID=3154750 RepID=UPI0034371ECE
MTVVAKYGSGLVRTKVLADPDDGFFTWVRTAGDSRTEPLEAPSPAVLDSLRALEARPADGTGVRCALPRAQDGELRYPQLPGRSSLARLLTLGNPPPHSDPPAPSPAGRALDGTETLLHEFGRTLRRLHTTPLPARDTGGYALPPAWRRLRAWADAPAHGRAGQLHGLVRALLGTDRWRRVEAWLRELAPGEPLTLVHGAPSLGKLVPSERHGTAHVLLAGEDIGFAPRQWDVGWVVAELREMRFFAARLPRPEAGWEELEEAFLRGYGETGDTAVGRAAALRVLLHLLDLSVLVTWDEEEVRRTVALIAELMDEQGSGQ